jgi:putative endonuclease
MTAESAVDGEKQDMLRRMARAYMRGFPERLRREVPARFDVVSVYLLPSGVEFELYRGAFGW